MGVWTLSPLATHMRKDLGVGSDVVSLILCQTLAGPRASRILDRATVLPERRRALEGWAAWLEQLRAGAAPGEAKVSSSLAW